MFYSDRSVLIILSSLLLKCIISLLYLTTYSSLVAASSLLWMNQTKNMGHWYLDKHLEHFDSEHHPIKIKVELVEKETRQANNNDTLQTKREMKNAGALNYVIVFQVRSFIKIFFVLSFAFVYPSVKLKNFEMVSYISEHALSF